MPSVLIFGEDYAHEVVLHTLIDRLAGSYGVPVSVQIRSASGGHGRMLRELKAFVAELRQGRVPLPDLFIVARDANCLGYAARVREITTILQGYEGCTVCAVPDPHIERWLLVDPQAFKQVFKRGCNPPDQKCDRDRYKRCLEEAVRTAGVEPLLGGVEFAEDLMAVMDLGRAETVDTSFAHLLRDLRSAFQHWVSA